VLPVFIGRAKASDDESLFASVGRGPSRRRLTSDVIKQCLFYSLAQPRGRGQLARPPPPEIGFTKKFLAAPLS